MDGAPVDRGRAEVRRWTGVAHRTLLYLLVAGLVAFSAVSAVARVQLHQWPWQPGPDRLHVCGRDFLGPGYHYTLQQVGLAGNTPIGRVETLRGERRIWGRHLTVGDVAGCGTGVYLQSSATDFRGYALSGGP